ncbi:hypothetical protein [Aldersonia kunmingensis]|uniref:hypothetical protein n=1 Tax=Aldersonia kunmingensis TaxID=408066 RepID=UPI000833C95A|nr:hypothetical protein [Aldersonia kunmingensis]
MTEVIDTAAQIGSIWIGRRFNGPPDSANGGYACGSIAQFIDGPARVVLRKPPPLETELAVHRVGDVVSVLYEGGLIAEARPAAPSVVVPPTWPTFAEAERATAAHPWRGQRHMLSDCFVCGPERSDGLHVTPGPLEPDAAVTATPFVPDDTVADPGGTVPLEIVWAALDCSSYPASAFKDTLCLLGTLSVTKWQAITVGKRYVAVGWTLSVSGRKHHTAAALIDDDRNIVAESEAIWVAI